MNDSYWQKRKNKIISSKGGWKIGEGVQSHGYDLINDLMGKHSYMQVIVLNATGRLPSKALADWIEAFSISMSWPDSRIWCNRVAALGGSNRSSIAQAVSAAIQAADSNMYGSFSLTKSSNFIKNAKNYINNGNSIADLVKKNISQNNGILQLPGYSRPIAKGDDRINRMKQIAHDLGFAKRDHELLADEIHDYISKNHNESMHLSGYVSAFLADQQFTAQEIYQTLALHTFSGSVACYIDSREQQEKHNFRPIAVDDIEYCGVADREI